MINKELDAMFDNLPTKVSKDFVKEKKGHGVDTDCLAERSSDFYSRRVSEVTIKEAAYQVMEQAYMKASANNTLPANARQIMYQARPLIQKLTDKMWKNDSLFTQNLLKNCYRILWERMPVRPHRGMLFMMLVVIYKNHTRASVLTRERWTFGTI